MKWRPSKHLARDIPQGRSRLFVIAGSKALVAAIGETFIGAHAALSSG
jgi:hypothetical protein